jgi:hypothetical protein
VRIGFPLEDIKIRAISIKLKSRKINKIRIISKNHRFPVAIVVFSLYNIIGIRGKPQKR